MSYRYNFRAWIETGTSRTYSPALPDPFSLAREHSTIPGKQVCRETELHSSSCSTTPLLSEPRPPPHPPSSFTGPHLGKQRKYHFLLKVTVQIKLNEQVPRTHLAHSSGLIHVNDLSLPRSQWFILTCRLLSTSQNPI